MNNSDRCATSGAEGLTLAPLVRSVLAAVAICVASASASTSATDTPVLWPEAQRAFVQDGPGLLLDAGERERLASMAEAERAEFIETFMARDPLPETPMNELAEAIERRRQLVFEEFPTFLDDRAKALFLRGEPEGRMKIECGETFAPLEVWTYGVDAGPKLLFYRPRTRSAFRLWVPIDSKRVLYSSEMEYWLEQYEELRSKIRVPRFDLRTCSETSVVDDVTGIEALSGYRDERPTTSQIQRLLAPPIDLAAWSREAAQGKERAALPVFDAEVAVQFPARLRQRMITRVLVTLPAEVELGMITDEGKTEHRLAVTGVVELDGVVFEEFRVRFKLAPTADSLPKALALERSLRPNREYLLRLVITDEAGGGVARVSKGFRVPRTPQQVAEVPVPEGVEVALGEELAERRIAGKDSLLLVPSEGSIVVGVWRAEALVSGERIARVVFSVDGEEQLTKTRPPFAAEVRLAQFPTEQVVRAAGFDQADELVAADEVVLNQPRGAFNVRILEPPRGALAATTVRARAEVVVPDERRVERVDFLINEKQAATREQVPWQADVELPDTTEVSYLTVVATLDDGSRAEAVRFLNAPRYLEEVKVDLVEVLTTVVDRAGRPVAGLKRDEFSVFEDGREQVIERFELVEDLPLSVGFAIDTSGSMEMALPEAQKAAMGFLASVITPRDTVFALGFSDEPQLLVPPTDDVRAVGEALRDLQSVGWTALYDAVVTSLYYFRGIRGRRALILLSDGADSASYYPFRDALEYARRSGVVVYTVGIGVSGVKTTLRRKLKVLAEETGGRPFFIQKAEELSGVYRSIEDELRSQYLITYSSDGDSSSKAFRVIDVELRSSKLKARAQRGYYPN